jgi:hypothetical protein
MIRNRLFLLLAPMLLGLALSSKAHGWGAYHVGYTHYSPYTGLHHYGYTEAYRGGYGGYGYHYGGSYGGAYRYGGYHYGGYPYGGMYGGAARYGYYRRW